MLLKIGHRGARGYAPENTLASFNKAIDLHAPMVELDVQLCRSGELVVIHDETVDRTTDGHGYIGKMSLHQLKKLHIPGGEKIPTLDEVLTLINHRVAVNIELKGKKTAAPVAETTKKYVATNGWTEDQFIVSSFYFHELSEFKKLYPTIRRGVLILRLPRNLQQIITDLGPFSINPSLEITTQGLVNEIHRLGCKVFVFTVNDPGDINRMAKFGVDGIFSDYPDRCPS